MNITKKTVLALGLTLALAISPLQIITAEKVSAQGQCIDESAVQLQSALRKLWIDHTIWTRSYIVSAVSNLPDKEKVLERLLRNQDDIGKAIEPYYGVKAAKHLAQLLREHILLAGKVLDAAKSGNQKNLKKYNAQWYKNADEIASFLSSANPNWSYEELRNLLYTHLKFVTDQVTTRLAQNWDAEIKAYDTGEDHIIKLADTLAKGIIKQFPSKFRNS